MKKNDFELHVSAVYTKLDIIQRFAKKMPGLSASELAQVLNISHVQGSCFDASIIISHGVGFNIGFDALAGIARSPSFSVFGRRSNTRVVMPQWAFQSDDMATPATYYEILDVLPTSTMDDIKHAYRKKAMRHHPDVTGDNGKMMTRLNQAKEVLLNEQKRARYNIGLTWAAGKSKPKQKKAWIPDLSNHNGYEVYGEVTRSTGLDIVFTKIYHIEPM